MKVRQWLVRGGWWLMLVSLPVTSFPLLSRLFGGTSVAPLSLIFLVFLLLAWYVPLLFKTRAIPRHSLPLMLFMILALISSLAGYFLLTPTFREISPWRNLLESLVTLGIGVCFYLVVSTYLDSSKKVGQFLRLINYSGLVMLLYALLQAAIFYILWNYPPVMRTFHAYISSSFLFQRRTTGLAYEPSWFAHLLNLVYLPIWLGMSIKKVSAHKFRVWKFSLENVLLVLGVAALFLSFSRIGWLAFIVTVGFLVFRLMHNLSLRLVSKIQERYESELRSSIKMLIRSGFWFITLVVMVGILIGAGVIMTKIDPRMAELFNLAVIREKGFLEWAGKLIFAERIIYWDAGLKVFLTYPILGVGLGRSGYFFQETFASFGYKLPEIVHILNRNDFIPNAKNLWVRLLAESGLIGFSVFTSYLYIHWKSARMIEKAGKGLLYSVGLFGQLFMVALLVEGFSVDTFGLPFLWVSLGVIAAVQRIIYVEKSNEMPGVVDVD